MFATEKAIRNGFFSKEAETQNLKLKSLITSCLSQDEYNNDTFLNVLYEITKWGRIPRVMGNLKVKDKKDLENFWELLKVIFNDKNPKSGELTDKQLVAIERILSLKIGVGLATVTKILRLGDPHRFVILYSVFRENSCHTDGKKILENCIGYCDFHQTLNELLQIVNKKIKATDKKVEIGDLEFSLYRLIRDAKNFFPKEPANANKKKNKPRKSK